MTPCRGRLEGLALLFLRSGKHRPSVADAMVPGEAAVHGMTLVFIGGVAGGH